MASEPLTGGLVLAAASAGVLTSGFLGTMDFPLSELAAASFFAVIGSIGRSLLDAKAKRDKAIDAGVPTGNLPRLDFVSLIYAIFATPLIGGLALAAVRGLGFLPDWSAMPVIMGVGYMGQDGVNAIISLFRDMIGRKAGKDG